MKAAKRPNFTFKVWVLDRHSPKLTMNIRFFNVQIEKLIHSLDEATIAKVLRTIDLLEMFGHKLTPPHSKKAHTQLFELRVRGKQELRVFYTFHKD